MPVSQKRLAKVCQEVISGVQLFGLNPRTGNLPAAMVDMQNGRWLLTWLKTISVYLFSGSDRLFGRLRGLWLSDFYGILP